MLIDLTPCYVHLTELMYSLLSAELVSVYTVILPKDSNVTGACVKDPIIFLIVLDLLAVEEWDPSFLTAMEEADSDHSCQRGQEQWTTRYTVTHRSSVMETQL